MQCGKEKKILQVLGLSQLFNNVLDNAHTTRPWATPYRWGSGSGIWLWDSVSRGPIPNSQTAQYQTKRHWVLFILFIFCVKLHYSRCSPPNIIPNRPAKKKTHAQLIKHKNSVLHGFFQLCQNLPQRVRALFLLEEIKKYYYYYYLQGMDLSKLHFRSPKIRFSIVITIV